MANLLDYTNYDFADLVRSIQDRLKNKEAWKDIYRSSSGSMMMEFLAYVLNLGLFYTERRAEESYILTAQNRSSVVNLVALLNYQPKRITSSVGNLTFSIVSPLTKIVYIPKYTECQSVDGIKFLTNEGAAIEKGQTSVTISSIQGELVEIEVTSNGSIEQEYFVNSTYVENSGDENNPTFRVIVDGEEWTKVSSFIVSDSTSKHYRAVNELDGTVSVRFGDNINGVAPISGSIIVIQYIKSDGPDGNVTYADKITTLNSTIYNEDGNQVTVSVTNNASFLGGDDEEDIEEIRYEAPRVFKTGQRAVTKEDFIVILENYPGVANVNVWGENEEAEAAGVAVDYEMLNKVKMSIILQEWELPDDDFKAVLTDYVYDQSMLTVKYEYITPEILKIIPTLVVKVKTGNSMSQAQADISTVLENLFKLGDTTKLGTIMKYSNIISALDDLDIVAYISMDLEIYKELSDSYDSFSDWGVVLKVTDILPESIRLFIDGTYITKDNDNGDGTGSFNGVVGGYTITNSSINYSTGVLVLDIAPVPPSVYVRYMQDENDNIVPTFNQICKLEEIDVTSISMES